MLINQPTNKDSPKPLTAYQQRRNDYSRYKNGFDKLVVLCNNNPELLDKLNTNITKSNVRIYSVYESNTYNSIISTVKILNLITSTDDISGLSNLGTKTSLISINDFYTSRDAYLDIKINFVSWCIVCGKFYAKLLKVKENDYLSQDIQLLAERMYLNVEAHLDLIR